MENTKKKTQFLGGFGSENLVEEFYLEKNQKLRPGTVISENEDVYKVELGIPFMRKEDIQVEVSGEKLIVSANRPMDDAKNAKERTYKGIFHISEAVRKEGIDVKFNDGLLTLVFPKRKIVATHETSYVRKSIDK
jgi:HSP20 family protein